MTVSDQEVLDVCHRYANIKQCLRTFCAAVNHDVMITLRDKEVVLVKGFGKCRPTADEIQREIAVRRQSDLA